ncbi:MAG: 2-C-methyl-D-erythritol 4-phosphate cytidylyltransferase [Gammaproteobacteria bacterium]|nr:2-C-methyl-D-erythritol 4-phosphate cytidylyltransferase [Gammaproteobacteria bacterium]
MTSSARSTALVGLLAAAGNGTRLAAATGEATPKQYLDLAGVPVIQRSLVALAQVAGLTDLVVVLSARDERWPQLKLPAGLPTIHTVEGGATRAASVASGLDFLAAHFPVEEQVQVLVHDAARPLVRPASIDRLVAAVGEARACGGILATMATDTLKQASAGAIEKTLDRSCVWQAQTPQLFEVRELRAAITAAQNAGIPLTDEASAMEYQGQAPLVVPGDQDNIKITHARDLALAEILLQAQEST